MKLNTHSPTPCPENNQPIEGLFMLSAILICSLFGLAALACFYYAHSFTVVVFVIVVPVLLAAFMLLLVKDMKRAYVEIRGHEIYVVDYYLGIQKEKHFSLSEITSAEICLGNSLMVKGYRLHAAGTQYIVFRNGKKYLFKIIYLPETEQLFKPYIQ